MTGETTAVSTDVSARFEHAGWSLWFASDARELPSRLRSALADRALKLAAGEGGDPLRRSRHASTYFLRLDASPDGAVEAFVKVLDPRGGWLRTLCYLAARSRAKRLANIGRALQAAGFGVAPLLMLGEEPDGGRAMLVTAKVVGLPLPRFLPGPERSPELKQETLRALGAEVARLHRAGFLHGDLTPYNVFVTEDLPARFVFIDHERTVRPWLVWQRRRLRNLVQLCRFELDGMSPDDQIQIVDAYAQEMGYEYSRLRRRLGSMLRARRLRDAIGDDEIAPAYGGSHRRPV